MGKAILVSLLVMASFMSAQGQQGAFAKEVAKKSAKHFGLTPETGYLSAVRPGESCDLATDVVVTESCDSYGLCFSQYITKCDSNIVGWVERTANGRDLRFGRGIHDFNLMLNTGMDPFGDPEYINIYTCGSSRDSDLAKDTRYAASRDVNDNFAKLAEIKSQKLNFKVQIFYNEYAHSGKCLGAIEIL